MEKHYLQILAVTLGAATLAVTILAFENVFGGPPDSPPLVWETVVNNSDHMPKSGGKIFNSYNQPSINGYGQVVLRARSKGGGSHGGGGGHEGGGGGGGENGAGSGSSVVAVAKAVQEAAALVVAATTDRATGQPTAFISLTWVRPKGRSSEFSTGLP